MEVALIQVTTLSKERLEGLLSLLPKDFQEHVLKYGKEEDRLRSAAAYAFLNLTLSKGKNLKLAVDERGKPTIPGYSFSVSHSGDFAVLAYEEGERKLGADIEQYREIELEKLAAFCFSDSEKQTWENSEGHLASFFCLWTRKEAYLKAVGLGLGLPLKSFSADEDVLNGLSIANFDVVEGYAFALCAEGPIDPHFRFVSLQEILSSYGI